MGRGLLLIIGGMFVVFAMILNSVNNRNQAIPERSIDYYSELTAENALDGAMDYALKSIMDEENWSDGLSQYEYGNAIIDITVYDKDTPLSDIPNDIIFERSNWDDYTVMVRGNSSYGNYAATSELVLFKNSYSKYSYLTEEETLPNGNNVWFIWSDVLYGPVHTNGTFHIAGEATFNGAVTSTNMWEDYEPISGDPQFLGGSNFNAAPVEFPTAETILPTVAAAQSGGVTFDEKVYLEFLSDGDVLVRETPNNAGVQNPNNYLLDMEMTNGVISSTKEIHVKGNVLGGMTIHSKKDIIIDGDIKYVTENGDPETKLGLLGLVSEQDVEIDKNAHRDSGNSNLTIEASILAMGESFELENYNQGSSKGVLNLYGGILQYRRGPMGTFRGGSIVSGYQKNYLYDERLEFQHPPAFPRLKNFTIRHWITTSEYVGN